ncbi:MAG: PA domain-containing protein, partial [Vicinamibacterales bacterium]
MRRSVYVAALLVAASLGAQGRAPEIESITQRDMKADLTFLASDGMAGRLTGTPQNAMAAEWVASRFSRLGLKPIGDDGTYYQKYTLATVTMGEGNTFSAGAAGTDWYPVRFTPNATAKGELVFVGFGISAPDRGYDDYGSAGSVKGKIVVALDHEPGERDENSVLDGVVTAQAADQLQKALAAQARGAVGILFVTDVHNHETPPAVAGAATITWPAQPPRIPRYLLGSWVEQVRIPAAQVSRTVIEKLMAEAKVAGTLLDLAKASETTTGSTPLALAGVEVELTTAVVRTFIDDRNVVGLLEGSEAKDEYVLYTAHWDHLGRCKPDASGDDICNGAVD